MTQPRWDQPSRLLSVDDDPARPTTQLVDIAIILASQTPSVIHSILDSRKSDLFRWYKVWPGEHYKLLTAAVETLRLRNIWEFGTFTGMGTLALAEGSSSDCKIYTIDNSPPEPNWFIPADESLIVRLKADFLSRDVLEHPKLSEAELIFLDGPKDGHTEEELLYQLSRINFINNPIFILDDIREMNMVYLWRNLRRPKMDMTSFGHFTGTGIIDWNGKLS